MGNKNVVHLHTKEYYSVLLKNYQICNKQFELEKKKHTELGNQNSKTQILCFLLNMNVNF